MRSSVLVGLEAMWLKNGEDLGGNCSAGKESTCSAGDTGDLGSIPGSERFPWRRKWQPTPLVLEKIPWIEDPCGLPLMGSQRERQD